MLLLPFERPDFREIFLSATLVRSYGEGNDFRQKPALRLLRSPQVEAVWQKNHQEIHGARMSMKVNHRWYAFLFVAAISIGLHYLAFELRFRWYVGLEDWQFLSVGYYVCVAAIQCLWALYPSRVAVAGVGFGAFLFPSALLGNAFVSLDGRFFAFLLLVVVLLVAATELRRRIRRD